MGVTVVPRGRAPGYAIIRGMKSLDITEVAGAHQTTETASGKRGSRLLSLDVLRGFDMLFIMGGGPLMLALCAALGAPDCAFAQQFCHVPWEGFAFEDLIFPLFLFIAGVSFPFSAAKRLAQGATRAALAWHAVRRGLTLIFLGLVYNGFLKLDLAHVRIFGVLQLIGLAWMVAALLYLSFGRTARAGIAVALLVGSWLLFRFVGAPDFPDAAPFSPEGNLGCWIDRTLFGSHIYKPLFDPEGTAGILPSIVTPMLGMFAGELLRSALSGGKKVLILLASSVAMVGCGLLMSLSIPVVKALWSSSFVLVAGGCSAALLALFYFVIDVKGWRGGTLFFRVIGMNAITIYLVQRVVGLHAASEFLFGGAAALLPAAWQPVGLALAYVATCWLLLYFLYRKNVFLKV